MQTSLLLSIAIATEVVATASLRAAGSGKLWAIATAIGGYGVALTLLAVLVRRMDVGVLYAVWSGAGTALVAVVGVIVLGESLAPTKLGGVVLIVVGVVLVNVAAHPE